MVAEIDGITSALKEQGTASQEIAASVQRIAQMAEENSTSAGQSASAARELQDVASVMVQQVTRFQT